MTRTFDQSNTSHATLLRRLGAIGYDILLVFSLGLAVTAVWPLLPGTGTATGPAFKSALFISFFCFFGFFWTRSGQTIGMMAWRIRVQSKEGIAISWTQALIRFLVAILSASCLGAGYLWMLVSDEKLTWQDMLSNSEVVYLPKNKS
ncbi:MAG: hypothetical protein OFPI_17780 [Osedax symbiont Rs2]|nr:MAG: hypothetical protein OFPI_17780 [Osedax symbiont Rs2]